MKVFVSFLPAKLITVFFAVLCFFFLTPKIAHAGFAVTQDPGATETLITFTAYADTQIMFDFAYAITFKGHDCWQSVLDSALPVVNVSSQEPFTGNIYWTTFPSDIDFSIRVVSEHSISNCLNGHTPTQTTPIPIPLPTPSPPPPGSSPTPAPSVPPPAGFQTPELCRINNAVVNGQSVPQTQIPANTNFALSITCSNVQPINWSLRAQLSNGQTSPAITGSGSFTELVQFGPQIGSSSGSSYFVTLLLSYTGFGAPTASPICSNCTITVIGGSLPPQPNPFTTPCSTFDTNSDGIIDETDMVTITSLFGTATGGMLYDVTGDNQLAATDLYIIRSQCFGINVTPIEPEPTPAIGRNPCEGGSCPTAFGNIPTNTTEFAGRILSIATGLAGGLALILMVIGAIRVLTSQGDQQRLAGGREMIIAAIAGLLFVILAVSILRLIGFNIFGFSFG